MQKLDNTFLDFQYLTYRMIEPIFDPLKFSMSFIRYIQYAVDILKYLSMAGSERLSVINLYPKIHERSAETYFDRHYFYQDIWAGRKIFASNTPHHYDVGSLISLIGHLTTFTKVTFIDIRPLHAKLKNLDSRKGDILHLPFKDNSLLSLSCLHVAEHIGLGRYGDRLDPNGTLKACRELARVLRPQGKLYFSLPLGKSRVCFNAHRIHTVEQILEYFKDLHLIELSGVDDKGNYHEHINRKLFEKANYACGLFIFTKN